MLQVMTADKDGGMCLCGILFQGTLQDILTGGVQEIEGLVQDDDRCLPDKGRDDANLLLVTCREVADQFFLTEDLATGEMLELLQALIDNLLWCAAYFPKEREILLRRQVVNQETFVDIGADLLLPLFR